MRSFCYQFITTTRSFADFENDRNLKQNFRKYLYTLSFPKIWKVATEFLSRPAIQYKENPQFLDRTIDNVWEMSDDIETLFKVPRL